ncbi:hypothetical protein [Terricaulis sp.]|uniref:hypothetical protein n=1 Tax=Terricaulis sp. TaxID=2768686 RepID=UPI002AC5BF51|nr:hypothetical protein [Terricaulis sp.]MDZ4690186.1 hypothetical protein [Terricaulis sp.]
MPANDDFRIVRVQPRPTSAREIDEQVRNLLNADGSPLQVECLRAQADNNQTTPLPLWRRALANLVIGQTSEDAARPFKKREFALFSIEDDRAAERETISIDLFIGLKDQIQFSAGRMEGELVPFLSVQRTSIDQSAPAEGERNDVTFGLTSPLYFFRSGGGLAHTLNVTAEWETDSDFDSSMTALRLAWTPFVRNTCLDWLHVWQSESSLNCGFAVVADYADVADPGEKIDLADVDQYGRVGLDLSFTWDQELTGESVLQFGAGYSFRSSFTDDDDGEADLITASLIFLPSDDSHFSFGIEYRHGEDLSSLDEQQTTMIRFGYRQ